MKYSENYLNDLINNNPKQLIHILSDPSTDVASLSFGIEILSSEIKDEEIVLPILKKMLKHINAIVRESAAIGVSNFYLEKNTIPKEILERLQFMSKQDPSIYIKQYTQSVLEDFNARS